MKTRVLIIPGFHFSGIHCGIKDDAKKKDLSLIFSEEPATLVDGVFTTNKVCAAPVKLCRPVIKRGHARLVVINSGIANACTGKKGINNAKSIQQHAAQLFDLKPHQICVCSTGKIGNQLPMPKLLRGLKKSKDVLAPQHFLQATRGIMTTDQYPKYGSIRGKIAGKPYHIAVLAKGAGMLCPNMATLLAFVVTDLQFSRPVLRKIFRQAVSLTLNRVTVDGDTSTNDTVLILANGRAGNPPFEVDSAVGKKIAGEMTSLLEKMARQIALDGEGATTCCKVMVRGARDEKDAKKIAYAIGNSPLVKTALFGNDPNWGRIMAAVGYSGAPIDENKINIRIGPFAVAKNGCGMQFNATQVSHYMKKKHIEINVQCGNGPGSFYVYMSDLTYDYVHLNAEYHT